MGAPLAACKTIADLRAAWPEAAAPHQPASGGGGVAAFALATREYAALHTALAPELCDLGTAALVEDEEPPADPAAAARRRRAPLDAALVRATARMQTVTAALRTPVSAAHLDDRRRLQACYLQLRRMADVLGSGR